MVLNRSPKTAVMVLISFDEGKNGNDVSSINFEGQDDLLLVNKNLFPGKANEWTIDFFTKAGEAKSIIPTGIAICVSFCSERFVAVPQA